MNEMPKKDSQSEPTRARASELAGRVLFLLAGGLLLAAMVSCACNPVR